DTMLEFCLEDGVRLVAVHPTTNEIRSTPTTQPTVKSPDPAPLSSLRTEPWANAAEVETVVARVSRPVSSLYDAAFQIVPVVLALAHNWWQWLYLEGQYVSSVTAYVLSANFLMWLLLLAAGTVASLFALKQGRHKESAYLSLVILAINLILFLVPRR
ncbi:MAG: hypothetical protein ABI539_12785, partial [Acidobacteriota bacterium]